MYSKFRGTGVALVTPFRNGKIDFGSLEKVIENCIYGKVEFLVSLGTTGETVTLSPTERKEVLAFTVKTVKGRVPVVAGFGGNNTDQIIDILSKQNFDGIDAILSVSPYYNRPTQEGIYQHYMEIAAHSPLPIIIYNVPSRTASNITAETTLRLANASEKFIGVKEASGILQQCVKIQQNKPEHFLVLSGDDHFTLPLLSLGMDGVISVVGNALPYEFSEMTRLGLNGDFAKARELYYKMTDIIDLLFVDGNPAGVKGALEMLGLCSKEVRLPLVPLTDATYLALRKKLFSLKDIHKIAGNSSL